MSMTVGGQAVIEGVMMRTPHSMAVAIRRADGSIEVREEGWYSIQNKLPFLKWPFFRGAVTLFEAMHNGVSALSWAAERNALDLPEEEGAKPAAEDGKPADDAGKPAPEAGSWAMTATIGVSFLFSFGLFIALPHVLTLVGGRLLGIESLDGQSLPFHIVAGTIKLSILLTYMWAISHIAEIRRVFQYHGAEHKSIYAWEAKEDLTVENAMRHTRLHPRCGTSFLFIVIITAILVFAVVFSNVTIPIENKILRNLAMILLKLPLLFPIAGIAYEFQRLSAKFPDAFWVRPLIWPGLMLQKITTQEPDAQQVEVALASLRAALARESLVVAGRDKVGARIEKRYTQLAEIAPAE